VSILKILFVSRFEKQGGASMAMNRLRESLVADSHDVEVLSSDAKTDWTGFQQGKAEQMLGKVLWRAGLDHLHTRGSFRLANSDWLESFDVIHLHNLHAGFFNYLALPLLARRKPVVWTLHDMWAFTGHCGYSMECARWKTGCGKCPHLHTYPYMHRDASALEWRLKRWSYDQSQLNITAPSRWLAEQARSSPLLGKHPVLHIPYSIDTQIWKPAPRAEARQRFGLPADAIVLLAVANDLTEPRKGGKQLLDILQGLPTAVKEKCVLLVAGKGNSGPFETSGVRVFQAGYLETERDRSLLYSAADLMLFTSMADNLPLVLMEAMACELPVVAFDVGGVSDLVRDHESGSLVAPFDTGRYAESLLHLLAEADLRQAMGQKGRQLMASEFSQKREASAFLDLYARAQESHVGAA